MNTFESIIYAIVLGIYAVIQWAAKIISAIWFFFFKSYQEKEYVPEGEVWNAWHLFGYEKEIDTLPAGSVCYPKRYSFISKLKTDEQTYTYDAVVEDIKVSFNFSLIITDAATIARLEIAQTMEGTRSWVGQAMSNQLRCILNDKLPTVKISRTGTSGGRVIRAGIGLSPFDCIKYLENNKQTIIAEALKGYDRYDRGITITDFDYTVSSTSADFPHIVID